MASRTEEMVRHLKALSMNTPDIEASAVVSVDGLIMASALPADVEEDRVSAMSAAMLSLGERIANELRRGQLDQVFVRGEDGYVILMAIGEEPHRHRADQPRLGYRAEAQGRGAATPGLFDLLFSPG
jgi:predicted regulator of Ras-like GTPase activity (Roadblock/LC7/MglB family)